jgi:hypothetical protein
MEIQDSKFFKNRIISKLAARENSKPRGCYCYMGAPEFLVSACHHHVHLAANRQQHVILYKMPCNQTAITYTNITYRYEARVIMRIHRQLLLPSIESCSKWVAVYLYPQVIEHGLSGILPYIQRHLAYLPIEQSPC